MLKRKVLTVGEKAEIIKKLEGGEKNTEICKQYGLSSSTVSTLWKNKDTILQAFQSNITTSKRLKKCEKPDLDEALLKWFTAQKNAGLPMNGSILKAQAQKFATEFGYENFSCTSGWIDRFKNRHNINYAKGRKEPKSKSKDITAEWLDKMGLDRMVCGENDIYNAKGETRSDFADVITTEWLEKVWLDYRNEYGDDDIYNAEEIGLFFNVIPEQAHKFKGKKCEDGELLKNRLTVLICSNMSGTDKRKLLVIGFSARPKCFQHVKQLPVDYVSNLKAWITPEIFASYMQKWDSEMRKQKRRIVLLIDNGPAHTKIPNLSNIKLVFLPPNSTRALQPLHQGIIRSFKLNYKKELIILLNNRIMTKTDQKVSILDAIRMMHDAWYNVTIEYIRNCFVKAMLQSTSEIEDNENALSISEWLKRENIGAFKDAKDMDDFISLDDGVLTSGIPTVEEIVAEMKMPVIIEDTDEEEATEIPTLEAAFACVDRLQSFFEATSSTSGDVFKAMSLLRHELREQRHKTDKR